MEPSALQKYILRQGYLENGKFNRDKLLKFYESYKKPPLLEDQVNIITKCLERLIDKEWLMGYGIRLAHKWFIKEIKLTGKGKQLAKKLLATQAILPFKKRRAKLEKIEEKIIHK